MPNKNNNGLDYNTENDNLLILPLNDKTSKKVSQIISNETAKSILDAIASSPLSASEIAEKNRIPLSTVQYNLEKLYDVGLVKVVRTKYSEKMKPMKIYAPQRKFVVITTENMSKRSIAAALKRYLVVIIFAVAGSAIIELLTMKMRPPTWEEAITSIPAEKSPASIIPFPTPVSPGKTIDMVPGFDIFTHPGLWFLIGCLFVILVIYLIEYFERRKE